MLQLTNNLIARRSGYSQRYKIVLISRVELKFDSGLLILFFFWEENNDFCFQHLFFFNIYSYRPGAFILCEKVLCLNLTAEP